MISRKLIYIVLLNLSLVTPAMALRCHSDLIQEGDTKFKVVKACGEPIEIEFVGYRLDAFGNRDLVVEQMIYGPWKGWYYLIELVGGKVSKIESFR